MGQKINPIGFRLGTVYTWSSRWFASGKTYSKYLLEDQQIRIYLMEKLKHAGIAKVEIERSFDKRTIIIHVSRPGIAIGRGGTGIEELKTVLVKKFKIEDPKKLEIRFEEIKNPDLDAYLVAQNVAEQLQRRIPFRSVINQSLERTRRSGAKGAKIDAKVPRAGIVGVKVWIFKESQDMAGR